MYRADTKRYVYFRCRFAMGFSRLALKCLGLLLVVLPTAAASSEPPSAYDLLQQVRRHYQDLDDYGDLGTIEHCRGTACLNYVFETVSDGTGAFLWRLRDADDAARERVVWSDGATTQVYDRQLDQRREIASPVVELALGLGDGGYDALVVAGLLAGDADALDDPEGAAVDGPEPCPTGPSDGPESEAEAPSGDPRRGGQPPTSCWLLSLSRMAGSIESYLWVGVDSLNVVRVETLHTPFSISGRPGVTTRLQVDHRVRGGGEGRQARFEAPSSSRAVERFEAPKSSASEAASDTASGRRDADFGAIFIDEITVELFSVPVRIFDTFGEPIRGLEPEDLKADIGGRPVPITHVDWVSPRAVPEGPGARQTAPGETASDDTDAREAAAWADWYWEGKASDRGPKPRVIVFFVQADFEPSRVRGHLRLLPLVRELIAGLEPEDRIALLTFDSHLRMWHDLTTDHAQVAETLYDAVRPGGTPKLPEPRGRGPFLRPKFDVAEARRVANAETALGMTAEALVPLDGRKEIIFLGWGLGEFRGGAVHMTQDYGRAVDALFRARATVSVLDVTEADWHALEFGLKNVAKATGGTYQRTFHFASQATKRLARQLQGYYVVYLDRQAAPQAKGRVHIRLEQGPGQVVHPNIMLGRR